MVFTLVGMAAFAAVNELVRTISWKFFAGVAGVGQRQFYDAPAGQDQTPHVQF